MDAALRPLYVLVSTDLGRTFRATPTLQYFTINLNLLVLDLFKSRQRNVECPSKHILILSQLLRLNLMPVKVPSAVRHSPNKCSKSLQNPKKMIEKIMTLNYFVWQSSYYRKQSPSANKQHTTHFKREERRKQPYLIKSPERTKDS